MQGFTFTDEQLKWLQIAVENSLASAKRTLEGDEELDDQLDAGLIANRMLDLQSVIGEPPDIALAGD